MKETITDKQAVSIIFLSILGSSIILGAAKPAKVDAWISIIIAVIISLTIGLCYARLSRKFHGKNLFEICEVVFGKIFGKIFISLFMLYAILINALIIRDFGEFIYVTGVVSIREISQVFIMTIVMLLCIYMSKKGLSTLGRFCVFFVPIVVFMLTMGYILSINNMSPRNILPIMYDGVKPVINGALSAISFPFTEGLVLLMIYNSPKNKALTSKIFTKGVLFSGLMLLSMTIFDIMILGYSTFASSYFPSYTSLRRISIGNFFERIELIIILSFIFGVFVKSSCYLIASCKGIACLFNMKDYTFISTPVGFFVVSIAYLLYENTKELAESAQLFTYLGISFQVVLFFIVFIGAEMKIRKLKR